MHVSSIHSKISEKDDDSDTVHFREEIQIPLLSLAQYTAAVFRANYDQNTEDPWYKTFARKFVSRKL